jgi:hypothetical protein
VDAGDEAGAQDGVARLQEGLPYEEDVEDDTDDVDVSSRYKCAVFGFFISLSQVFIFCFWQCMTYCMVRAVVLRGIRHAIAKPVS